MDTFENISQGFVLYQFPTRFAAFGQGQRENLLNNETKPLRSNTPSAVSDKDFVIVHVHTWDKEGQPKGSVSSPEFKKARGSLHLRTV